MAFPKNANEMKAANYRFDDYATCRGCDDEIEWWITPTGKKIPMNPMPRGTSEAIAHWITCIESDLFRGKR